MYKFEQVMESGRAFFAALRELFVRQRFAPTRRNVWSF